MSEIEKIKRYIERTKMDLPRVYGMNVDESLELSVESRNTVGVPIKVIYLAFNYGRAKGYRAAKAEAQHGQAD